jgi:ABC-type uncharacterized transport system permease subunit
VGRSVFHQRACRSSELDKLPTAELLRTAAFSDTAQIDGSDSAHSDYRTIADQVSFDVSGRADLCFKTEDGRPTIHLGRLHPLVEASGMCIARSRLAAFVMSAFIVGLAGGLYAHFLGILTVEMFYTDLNFISIGAPRA